MTGYSKKNREDYPERVLLIKRKRTPGQNSPGVSANRRSNNWALVQSKIRVRAREKRHPRGGFYAKEEERGHARVRISVALK